MDTWLIVFVGSNIERVKREVNLLEAHATLEQAHHLLMAELEGARHALLLVHWTALERDTLLERVSKDWSYFFVNQVRDLQAENEAL